MTQPSGRIFGIFLALFVMGTALEAETVPPAIQQQWDKAIADYQAGDFVSSAAEFKQLCLKQVGSACSNLGFQYEDGQGVEKNLVAAREFYERGCSLNHSQGCISIGFMYSRGLGIEKDEAKAVPYFKKACDLGDHDGCHDLALMFTVLKDFTEAAKLFDTGCKAGDVSDCAHLSTFYLVGNGVSRNSKLAYELGKSSCESGIAQGCKTVGIILSAGVPPYPADKSLAATYFEKARSLEQSASR